MFKKMLMVALVATLQSIQAVKLSSVAMTTACPAGETEIDGECYAPQPSSEAMLY